MKYLIHPESDSAFQCECSKPEAQCCLQDGCVSEVDYETYRKFLLDNSEPSLTTPPSACYISRNENGTTHRRAFPVSVTLTISVDDPRDLAAAVATLASSLGSAVAPTVAADPAVPAEAAPARRGRKTKEQPEAPTAPETPAAATEPAAVATSAAPPATPAPAVSPAPTPAPAAVEVPAAVSKKDVQDLLIAAMKQFGNDGRAIVGAICRAHGGPNLSALAESTYPALYRDAKALLAMSADQAKATYLAVAA